MFSQILLLILGDTIIFLRVLALTNHLSKPFIMSNYNQLKILLPLSVFHNSVKIKIPELCQLPFLR